MGFEQAKFGDGSATGSGNVTTAVAQHYGRREVHKDSGSVQTEGTLKELSMTIDGAMITAEAFPLLVPKLPAGTIVKNVFVEVLEVFVVGGDSATINVGTEGSENTNGFEVTEAQAEATGTYDVTASLQGTWAAPLAAETTIGLDMDGTTPTITSAGKMRVVVQYVDM